MAGTSIGPDTGGLLAKKGSARPAMRRQSQIQQTGFGGSGASSLSGWLTGTDDDCGWNDMGDRAAPAYGSRSAIGLTAMNGSPDSLYIDGNPGDPDWDEAGSYDDDTADWNAPAAWNPAPAPAANPVGAMQQRLQAATAQAAPVSSTPVPSAPVPSAKTPAPVEEPLELQSSQEIPVGLFGAIRAFWARLGAMILGRGPVVVLHLDPALRERLRTAAYRESVDPEVIAERAIEDYLGALASKSVNANRSDAWS